MEWSLCSHLHLTWFSYVQFVIWLKFWSNILLSLAFLYVSVVKRGCHLSYSMAALPFSVFSLLGFCVFYFVFVVPFVDIFCCPLYGFCSRLCWCFVSLCGYFYFDSLINGKVIQIYFERRHNTFFKLQHLSCWSSI